MDPYNTLNPYPGMMPGMMPGMDRYPGMMPEYPQQMPQNNYYPQQPTNYPGQFDQYNQFNQPSYPQYQDPNGFHPQQMPQNNYYPQQPQQPPIMDNYNQFPNQSTGYPNQFDQYNTPNTNSYPQYQSNYIPCGGNKKALLIGINYYGTQSELRGCINDVKNLQSFLIKNGFPNDDQHMRILTDDSRIPQKSPTKQNILNGMNWLVQGAQPGDSLFFHFSGHGSQQKDTDGDEDDGFDETICPVDYKTNGMIVDDLMHKVLVQSLPAGCRLTFIADSCHSGTALDLPFVYNEKGLIPNNKINQSKISQSDVIGFSGCLDNQCSSDTIINGQATGALSYAFIRALNENTNLTFTGLLGKMREILNQRNKFVQIPQMSSSHQMDMNYPFKI